MKSAFEICDAMNNFVEDVNCNSCGEYDMSQPCDVPVPNHIPEEQIKDFIDIKMERDNAEIL